MAKNTPQNTIKIESVLIQMCLEAATRSGAAVEAWRRQRRTLERMPSHLAEPLFHRLIYRGLLFPSLLEVFKYSVEEVDLRSQNCVDAEWLAYLGGFNYMTSLNLADCHRLSSSALWPIIGLPNLKEIDLSRCSKVNDSGIRHLSSFSNMERLCISETGVSAKGIMLLSSLTNLSYLDLGGLPVSDLALSHLQGLKKLQFLDIWGSEISNHGAALLQYFPQLSSLNLAWTKMTELPNLSSLEYLNISNCTVTSIFKGEGGKARLVKLVASYATFVDVSGALSNVEFTSLAHLDLSNAIFDSFFFLPHLSSVTYLDLAGSSMADDSVENMVCIGPHLKFLSLNYTKVSSNSMAILAGHLSCLETLLLSGTYIDDAAIPYIGMMPMLKVINLSGTKIKGFIRQEGTDSWIPSLAPFQELCYLERLDLEGVQLKDAALYPFSGLRSLEHLSLQSAILTDESLLYLSAAKKLERLSMRDAILSNAGLELFTPPPRLRLLDLQGCWLLTEEAIVLFGRKYPGVHLIHESIAFFPLERSDSPSTSSVSRKTSSLTKAGRFSGSPSLSDKSRFLATDQRLKYNREELLELQISSTPSIHGVDICTIPFV